MHERSAALGIAGIAASWGAIGVIVRQVDLPAVAIVAARCWLATLTILLVAATHQRRTSAPAATRAWLRLPQPVLVTLLGVLLAGHWLLLVGAQQRAPIGTVLLLTYLAPVVVALLAPVVVHEHVPRRTLAAMGVALAGTVLLARPEPGQGTGIALAIAAGLSYAAITLLSKRVVGAVGGVRLAAVQLGVAGLVLVPAALLVSWGPPSADWLWLVVLGVVFTGALGPLYLVLLGRLPVATVGVLTYLEPVSAVLLAWLFLDEEPSAAMLAGGVLIVGAGLAVLAGRSAAPNPHPERRFTRAAH